MISLNRQSEQRPQRSNSSHIAQDKLPRSSSIPQKISKTSVLPLIAELCQQLNQRQLNYCHWKSNAALDRSANGKNDLDLLIARSDVQEFTAILYGLGFKDARLPAARELPGILNYYGYDQATEKFVHVHAHYQLILGHDATKNYRLPIEEAYLQSSNIVGNLFKVPSLEFEFIVFVMRMILKHSSWDSILGFQGALTNTEQQELDFLTTQIDQAQVALILQTYLSFIDIHQFQIWAKSLQPGYSKLSRMLVHQQLLSVLNAHGRQPHWQDISLKIWRRFFWGVRRYVFQQRTRKRFASGGLMIAIVGGDGSGKSTAVNELSRWLGKTFETKQAHLGKPPWSLATLVLRALSKAGRALGVMSTQHISVQSLGNNPLHRFPGYLWLLRHVFMARDRYRLYRTARRWATNGRVVICDRYPLSQIKLMDGIQAGVVLETIKTNVAMRFLINLEAKFYSHISPPDVVIVLRVDPEIAIQRRLEDEPGWIRDRSQEIWTIDWSQKNCYVIDAGQPQEKVLADIKTLVWSQL
ncbi:MAG: hypothetical protein AAF572_11510 [Cyanobacteria bacterium P01_B01_bin.77]